MTTQIYLFCNQQYGKAYQRAFEAFAGKNPIFDCYVVHSQPNINNGTSRLIVHFILNLFSTITRNLYTRHVYKSSIKTLRISNVNNHEFLEKIPVGSFGFIAGFNQIMTRKAISKFSLAINFHPSILPYYRGSIPSYWAILYGEKKTGVTAHHVTERIDGGEIIYQEIVEINPGITENELDNKIASVGACYFTECLEALRQGTNFRHRRIPSPYKKNVDYVSKIRSQT